MKFFLILVATVAWMAASGSEPKMRLHGEYPSATNGEKLYLNKGENIIDSATLKNGKFEFSLKNVVADEYSLMRVNKDGNGEYVLIYLDNFDTYVKLEKETYVLFNTTFIKNTVSGNPTHSVVSEINEVFMQNSGSIANNPDFKAKLTVAAERGDMATAYVMWKYASTFTGIMKSDQLKHYVDNLKEDIKQTPVGKRFLDTYASLLSLMPGGTAPDFTMNTPEGNPVTLSKFLKGKKIVLIDFWASWCGPCRKKNPEVLELYSKFHDKGLDVLSVSLDDKLANWKRAIADDKLPWKHVSDLKGWKSEICKTYNFNSIPCLFLLDGEGRILASGNDLRQQLHEYVEKFCKQ